MRRKPALGIHRDREDDVKDSVRLTRKSIEKSLAMILGLLSAWTPRFLAADLERASGPPLSCFVSEFVSAWEQRDETKLSEVVEPNRGIWIIFNVGVTLEIRHFGSLNEAISQGEHGAGNLGVAGFGDCRPILGSPPTCNAEGIKEGYCKFGSTESTIRELFESRVLVDAMKPEDLAHFRRDSTTVDEGDQSDVYFLSDDSLGAVFYFTRSKGGWRLLLIDTSDCSA